MSVYFAAAGGYVKIGYSADPIERAATITTGGTRPADVPRGALVDLLGWVPGAHAEEAQWHRDFAADHVAGEWFYIDPALIRERIWADPCGIDLLRMTSQAVIVPHKNPGISREQIAMAGIEVNAPTPDVIHARMSAIFAGRQEAVT